ncbi:MAG: hypothetical protein ACEPOV_06005 [Hyphomicrobiales bacterium]
MKKITYITVITIAFCLSTITLNAQNNNIIPNNSLEEWENNLPVNWDGVKIEVPLVASVETTSKETNNPYNGNSCVKLESKKTSILGTDYLIPGALTLGKFDIDYINREVGLYKGIPCHHKPSGLNVYVKATPNEDDACSIVTSLWTTNSEGVRDTISENFLFIDRNIDSWEKIDLPFVYTKDATPDSLNIIFCTNRDIRDAKENAVLYIDQISLYFTTSLNLLQKDESIELYAPLSSKKLITNIKLEDNSNTQLNVINTSGRIVKSIKVLNSEHTEYDLHDLKNDIYIITITRNNSPIYTQKIGLL